MERLTKQGATYGSCEFMDDGIHEWINKLSAYEDTGLTPEEITEFEKLCVFWQREAIKAQSELGEMKIAEEQGLLIKLPCKVGDTLYDIYEFLENRSEPDITEYKAETIEIGKDKHGAYFCIASTIFRPGDFGKSVFLTREEAEKALQEGVKTDE